MDLLQDLDGSGQYIRLIDDVPPLIGPRHISLARLAVYACQELQPIGCNSTDSSHMLMQEPLLQLDLLERELVVHGEVLEGTRVGRLRLVVISAMLQPVLDAGVVSLAQSIGAGLGGRDQVAG